MSPALCNHQVIKAEEHHDDEHGGCKAGIEDELEEEFHVFSADTIIDPGAVMVHLEYAPAALAAVMRSLGLPVHLALSAVLDPLHRHIGRWILH